MNLKMFKYFVLLFFLIIAPDSGAIKENISNVKITNIFVNSVAVTSSEYSDIVISSNDSIKFEYKLEELSGVINGAYIFKIVFRNSQGDTSVKTSGIANCMYYGLSEDNYELGISAFDVDGKWVTASEIIKFRVNNREAKLIGENRKLLSEKKVADSLIQALSPKNIDSGLFDLNSIRDNNIFFILVIGLIILLLLIIFLLIIKIRKQKTRLLDAIDIKSTLGLENKNLKIQMESDTLEMLELKKTIDEISRKMSDMAATNAELTSSIKLVNSKTNELVALQETKNTIFSDILKGIADPTASIKSLVELLRSYDFNATDTKEIVENIVETTQKIIYMSEDIQRLIEFEKNSEINIKCDDVSISKLINEAVEINKKDASYRKIKIGVNIAPDINNYYLDYDKILVVLHNLINNAVKYTYGGGNVLISCYKNNSNTQELVFEVKDDGVGINEKDLKELRSLSSGTTNSHTNMEKIGFMTIRKYVEAHKGKLNVASIIGKGSTFSFTIPDLRKIK